MFVFVLVRPLVSVCCGFCSVCTSQMSRSLTFENSWQKSGIVRWQTFRHIWVLREEVGETVACLLPNKCGSIGDALLPRTKGGVDGDRDVSETW